MPASPSSPPRTGGLPSDTADNPELLRFREEWLAELQHRKEALKAVPDKNISKTPGTASQARSQYQPGLNHLQRTSEFSVSSTSASGSSVQTPAYLATHPALKNGEIQEPSHTESTVLGKALRLYRRAVEHEQRSERDEALLLYRQAFRLDDNVDRAYHREEMLKSALKDQRMSQIHKPPSDIDTLALSLKEAAVITSTTMKHEAAVTGTLANLVEGFLQDKPRFEPEDEMQPVLLNLLPEELLVDILGNLGPTSLERFARVCKKARVLTLDPGIWRQLVRRTYHPPQVPDYDTILQVIERYSWDFRRVYIEQPRLRLDGVYIATCHYVRPGFSENSWVNATHLVTYHRYLRFYPNGQVLSLLANEEYSPQQIIPILKPTLRMNGLFFGQWELTGTRVHLTNLMNASGKFALPMSASVGLVPEPAPEPHPSSSYGSGSSRPEAARHAFVMTLSLRSRPLGRWNRMDIEGYESVNIETGDIYPIVLKHEKPFWFSKVRSYSKS